MRQTSLAGKGLKDKVRSQPRERGQQEKHTVPSHGPRTCRSQNVTDGKVIPERGWGHLVQTTQS